MLCELQVKNLALIESLRLSFGPGANILTGETGAGKSILAGALGLLRGARASGDMLRSGAGELSVEALFTLEKPENFQELFESQGLAPAEELILKRVVLPNGRSRAWVNGSLSTLSQLSQWGEELLAISSQHDQQTLLNSSRQLDFLDAFGNHKEYLLKMSEAHRLRERAEKELQGVLEAIRDGEEKKDFFEFQLREINKVAPKEGEDDLLMERKNRAKSAQRLSAALTDSLNLIYQEGGLLSGADRLKINLDKLRELDDSLKEPFERALGAAEEISSLGRELKNLHRSLGTDRADTEEADERLSLLSRLKRKYGPTLEDVLLRKKSLEDALSGLETMGLERVTLEKKLKSLEKDVSEAATTLHAKREEAAERLSSQLTATLMVLGFPKVELKVEATLLPPEELGSRSGPKGGDNVSFLFCPNPGEGLKPLSRIASGGELSRVMLALKTAQEPRSDQSLVFDEIDSGLSGATAEAVAAKMAELSQRQQVFVITHQPLMAAIRGCHFVAEKNPGGGRTLTSISRLSEKERLDELARMLDGATPSPQAIALSKRLLSA
ncbi:MAG: DNA repair protein RecN [Deltaproteobacteria bacterium]|jgi:DNA repair protein RecN (Recombination protein N)|nr:DNA repair protein RecN [Deltaproteobacteria bacterium]